MYHVIERAYRGWKITIHCCRREFQEHKDYQDSYRSTAIAELESGEDPEQWIDPRVQMLDTGERIFPDHAQCIDELYTEACELVDALKK